MPAIRTAVLRYVSEPERDERISYQCERFASITLDQLRVKPALQSREVVPFINAITQLRYIVACSGVVIRLYNIHLGRDTVSWKPSSQIVLQRLLG